MMSWNKSWNISLIATLFVANLLVMASTSEAGRRHRCRRASNNSSCGQQSCGYANNASACGTNACGSGACNVRYDQQDNSHMNAPMPYDEGAAVRGESGYRGVESQNNRTTDANNRGNEQNNSTSESRENDLNQKSNQALDSVEKTPEPPAPSTE